MAEFAALPLFTDSWVADTAHLSRLERGLYMDLIILMWRSPECRVPNNQEWIGRHLKVTDEEAPMLKMICEEFCSSDGNWLRQKRLVKESRYLREKTKKMSDMAKSRWNKEKDTSLRNAAQHARSNAPTPTPTPTPTPSLRSGRAREKSDDLETQLREAAGWQNEPAPMLAYTGPIQSLLDAGIDLNLDVLPIVRALAPRAGSRSSWKYFPKAILEAHSQRLAGTGKPNGNGAATAATQVDDEVWLRRLGIGRTSHEWQISKFGPIPGQPGCLVPAKLLAPDDGVGWTDWVPKTWPPPIDFDRD